MRLYTGRELGDHADDPLVDGVADVDAAAVDGEAPGRDARTQRHALDERRLGETPSLASWAFVRGPTQDEPRDYAGRQQHERGPGRAGQQQPPAPGVIGAGAASGTCVGAPEVQTAVAARAEMKLACWHSPGAHPPLGQRPP